MMFSHYGVCIINMYKKTMHMYAFILHQDPLLSIVKSTFYSQFNKVASALIFGVGRFHKYLFGRLCCC